jgi:ECF transporter S component (folate family)
MLIALDVIFTRFLSATPGGLSRISLQFLPDAMMGALLGPLWAGLGCAAADVLGMLINSQGLAYTPLFTLSALVRGLLYGLMLTKVPGGTAKKTFFGLLAVSLVVELGMNPVWLTVYYGNLVYSTVLTTKLITEAIFFPVKWAVLAAMYRYLMPAVKKTLHI